MGQVVIALVTAGRFSPETLKLASHYILPLMLSVIITGGLSFFNGYLLSRWTSLDRATGFLGSIPGAGPAIVAMSEEMGADAVAVALIQYIRILMVAAIIPSIVVFFFPAVSHPIPVSSLVTANNPTLPSILNLLVLCLCGALGVIFGTKIGLPSASFLGPFLTGLAAFWVLPYRLYIPEPLFTLGLMFIGLSIGLKFDRQASLKLIKAICLEIILVLGLILACFGVGYAFHLLTNVDTTTAILGSTPGGLSAIIATTIQIGGDSGLVLAMQMIRMLLILFLSPFLASYWLKNKQEMT